MNRLAREVFFFKTRQFYFLCNLGKSMQSVQRFSHLTYSVSTSFFYFCQSSSDSKSIIFLFMCVSLSLHTFSLLPVSIQPSVLSPYLCYCVADLEYQEDLHPLPVNGPDTESQYMTGVYRPPLQLMDLHDVRQISFPSIL